MIPARFSFRPFNAKWEICTAELVGWREEPDYSGAPALILPNAKPFKALPEHEQVTVRIGESMSGLSGLYGQELSSSHTVEMLRSDIPTDVLAPHENRQNSPDIAGRTFSILVCSKPEFTTTPLPSALKPGDAVKNAWAMRDEFVNLSGADSDDPFDWLWSLRQFLNRWGLWNRGVLTFGMNIGQGRGFVVELPHLLRAKREEYRKALEPKSAGKWLSTTNPLSTSVLSSGFSMSDNPPYFLVERFYCDDAIRATITIDHLAKKRFGFCKRCGKQFEQENQHKKHYCSRKCIQAAGVQRWREKQRKASRKGAKRNAKG